MTAAARVVDTSAIVAVLLSEPDAAEIEAELLRWPCMMSAATRVELGIVVESKLGAAGTLALEELLGRLDLSVVPVDDRTAAEALAGWRRFGRGRHPAALNLGDTFSYALAVRTGLPLLWVGADFGRTDVPRTDTGADC